MSGETAGGSSRDYAAGSSGRRAAGRRTSRARRSRPPPSSLAQSRAAAAALGTGPAIRRNSTATWAGPLAHLHHRPQAFEQRAVAAKRRGPGGAQRLDRAGAAEIEAEFGFAGAWPRRLRRHRHLIEAVVRRTDARGDVVLPAGLARERAGRGRGGSARLFAAFSTRAIEPVMPSMLCSRVATRAEQPFAVGGERADGFGQPPAFAGVERADRLERPTE